ncbi:scavenger receptor cysteine-rich domain-containing group B protein-like isoform X2 [Apostichopus japonicus]|uniref:scavenger receptor cysteine-rich domain-containing group B protein-like isoform X2 n=1 Tax=Stichopus japonicus TaxID=307972 RepID=UPI003AB64D52
MSYLDKTINVFNMNDNSPLFKGITLYDVGTVAIIARAQMPPGTDRCGDLLHYRQQTPYCQYVGQVRLRDGGYYYGRVEIYYNGQWGTVCDNSWELNDAKVVCRQLGFPSAVAARTSAYYGQGTGPILLDEVECVGYETRLEYCTNEGWYIQDCGHWEDAGVECLTDIYMTSPFPRGINGDVRLTGGSKPNEGRVEIYYYGTWYTVCDDNWDSADATVVCRQLGYLDTAQAVDHAYFGSGYLDILLDDVECYGWESTLLYCSNAGLFQHDCGYSEVAGVICGNEGIEGDVRLRDGDSINSGRVEVYHLGEWGTICDEYWSNEDAAVICRQLGYSGGDTFYSGALFGQGSGPILGDISCDGTEWYWEDCYFSNWATSSCSHSEDAALTCTPFESPVEGSLKLVDGYSVYSGRIEIYHNGEWGTICDDDWDEDDAHVACRQLGYPTVDSYGGSAYYGDRYGGSASYGESYGEGSGPIMLDDVRCDGSEYMLTQCGHNGWYQHNCGHGEDAWVTCQIPVTYYPRLVAGNNWYEGRVEVWDGSRWERLCTENFNVNEASTVCKQIGYYDYEEIYYGDQFGISNSPPSDVSFSCGSNDYKLGNCLIFDVTDRSYCASAAIRCKISKTSLQTGTIAGIVIACAIVAVLIGIGLVVTYRLFKKNRGRVRTQPNIAVISGVDTPAGPPAPRHNWTNVAAPPSYNDVVNNHAYYPQHVDVVPTIPGLYPPQSNPETVNTQQAPTVHPPPNPDFLIPYPVETSSVTTQPANPFQVQAGQFPSDNVPLMLSSQNQPAT